MTDEQTTLNVGAGAAARRLVGVMVRAGRAARTGPCATAALLFVLGLFWGPVLGPAGPGTSESWVPALHAQTATMGVLSGVVRGEFGEPVEGVEVTLVRGAEVGGRVIAAGRDGRFTSGFLPPGEYELVAERFGYVPVRVTDVPIRSGRHATVELTLREAPPPVTEVDRVGFALVGGEWGVGSTTGLTRAGLRDTPFEGRELTGALSHWSLAGSDLAVRGLPGRHTTVNVDGLRLEPASHPVAGPGFLHLVTLPRLFLQEVELAPHGVDTEWGEGPGALLRATTVRGRDYLEVEAFGTALGSAMGSEGILDGTAPTAYGPDGGILVRGPLRPDTVHFAFGLHARQTARPLGALAASSPAAGASFLELTGDAGLPEGRRLGTPRLDTWNVISTFGRMDWRVGRQSALTLRSTVGIVRDGNGTAPRPASVMPRDPSEATDVAVGSDFFTAVGETGAVELRAAFESSTRDHGLAALDPALGPVPLTWVQEGGILVGSDPGLAGEVRRSAFRLAPVAHFVRGAHQLKLGFAVSAHGYAEEGGRAAGTGFAFPDLAAFQDRRGLRVRSSGPARDVDFRSSRLAFFIQDRWSPSPGLTLTGGVRLEGHRLPWDEILPSEGWASLTGVERSGDREPRGRVSPRFGVEWSPGAGDDWMLRGSVGVFDGEVDPALLAEILADSGAVRIQRTLGTTGAWPSGGAEVGRAHEGARLSLLGPRFEAPRTTASEVGLVSRLTASTALELSVGHRRTEFLPRRRDLNLTPGVWARDQFGRELRGEVVREGAVISIVPGSDRRFQDFEVVSGIESDGWSEWLGATVALRHGGGGPLAGAVEYTLSRTQDNIPGFGAGWPAAAPGRVGTGASEPLWVEGRSDLDAPHRLVASGVLSVSEQPGIRIGALYGFHSGRPFSPGVRDLLNGTSPLGWQETEPVALPSGLSGGVAGQVDDQALSSVMSRWSCLGELSGRPAQRNACRTDPVHELNVRLGVTLPGSSRWSLELTVDGLNLLDSGPVIPDAALFMVDGTRPLTTGADGSLVLPVRVNPDFGEPLLRLSPGRSVRIGLGVRH